MWRCAACKRYCSEGKARCNSTISHVWLTSDHLLNCCLFAQRPFVRSWHQAVVCWKIKSVKLRNTFSILLHTAANRTPWERDICTQWAHYYLFTSVFAFAGEIKQRRPTCHTHNTATADLWCRCMRGWRAAAWNFISCTTWFSPRFWPRPQSRSEWPLIVCICVHKIFLKRQ